MSTAYRPFANFDLDALRTALRRPIRSLDDFSALRRDLGRPGAGAGFRLMAAAEPEFLKTFVDRIAPSLTAAALRLVEKNPLLQIHQAGAPALTEIPRAEVAGFVAHLLLGTLAQPEGTHPRLDGSGLLERKSPAERSKLRCMLTYFERIESEAPRGNLSVERLRQAPRSAEDWARDESPLGLLDIEATATIEQLQLHRQADFANAYLGGGVLSGGCVQEEIRFSISPELLFGMIVSPRLNDDEAIVLRGSEQFADTKGYAFSLSFAGSHEDKTPRRADGSPDSEVIAMDAIHFAYRASDSNQQFEQPAILRELNKARVAFLRDQRNLPIATGNWGCGAFNGDPPLKAIIQWLAASAEGRAIRYCTFNDPRIAGFGKFSRAARKRYGSVGALWKRLIAVAPEGPDGLLEKLTAL